MSEERGELIAAIARALDEQHDPRAAAALVRQLMFIDRFASDIGLADEAGESHSRRASA
jgi:hypothetical protein